MIEPKKEPSEKALEIMKSAQSLMQMRGYNGFSFRDVADDVGIRSASIHYHFATKPDLAQATAAHYRQAFLAVLDNLKTTDGDAVQLLRQYGALFQATLIEQGKVCLGGVLASDAETLPTQVRGEVIRFFEEQIAWVAIILEGGQLAGEIRSDINPVVFAKTFVAGLEGAMIVARSTQRPEDLVEATEQMIALVAV